ncbi:MAG: hypothetical protein HY288_13760 [Planctomycetia bacterium]|nr:hypothetical protein [Planctomycetia bacterium]
MFAFERILRLRRVVQHEVALVDDLLELLGCRRIAPNEPRGVTLHKQPSGSENPRRASVASPFARAVLGGFDFQIGNQQQIDDVRRIIGAIVGYRATARRACHEFTVLNRNLSTVGQVYDERLKWLGIV